MQHYISHFLMVGVWDANWNASLRLSHSVERQSEAATLFRTPFWSPRYKEVWKRVKRNSADTLGPEASSGSNTCQTAQQQLPGWTSLGAVPTGKSSRGHLHPPSLSRARPLPSPRPLLRAPQLFPDAAENLGLSESHLDTMLASSPSKKIRDRLVWFPKEGLLLFRLGSARAVGTLSVLLFPSVSFSGLLREQLGASNKDSRVQV